MKTNISRILAAVAFLASAGLASADNVNTNALITLTAQGAGTIASPDMPNLLEKGLAVGVNLTTMTTATVVIHIQGKDSASGVYYDVLVGPSLTTAGFTPMVIYPGVIGGSNSISWPLPKTWRVEAVVTGGSAAATGTIGASLIE